MILLVPSNEGSYKCPHAVLWVRAWVTQLEGKMGADTRHCTLVNLGIFRNNFQRQIIKSNFNKKKAFDGVVIRCNMMTLGV